MNVYVASSWRNTQQPEVVATLRHAGFDVYDFREPAPGNHGFDWAEIDPKWQQWSPGQYREHLADPIADHGFELDMKALVAADAVVLVQPCGRSAHLELGYAAGLGRHTVILLCDGEPELMYKMVDFVAVTIEEVTAHLAALCRR